MESLRSPFEPEQFQDNYKEKVLTIIETKRAGATPKPGVEKRRLAPVIDLMTALKQSLAEKERAQPTLVPAKTAAAKKAPQREGKEVTAKPRKQKAI